MKFNGKVFLILFVPFLIYFPMSGRFAALLMVENLIKKGQAMWRIQTCCMCAGGLDTDIPAFIACLCFLAGCVIS